MPSNNHHRRAKPQVKSSTVASANTAQPSNPNNSNNTNTGKKSDHSKPAAHATREKRSTAAPAAVTSTSHPPPTSSTSTTSATTTTTAPQVKGSWSAMQQGGNVLQWLSQKAQHTDANPAGPTSLSPSSHTRAAASAGVVLPSRGAIEYLQARQAESAASASAATGTASAAAASAAIAKDGSASQSSKATSYAAVAAARIPKPRSHTHELTTTTNTAAASAEGCAALACEPAQSAPPSSASAQHAGPAHTSASMTERAEMHSVAATLAALLPGKVHTQSQSSSALPHTTLTEGTAAAAAAAAAKVMNNDAKHAAEKGSAGAVTLAQALHDASVSSGPVRATCAAEPNETHTSTSTNAHAHANKATSLPRGVRGRRRQDDRLSQLQRQVNEVRKKHEEAMRSDPDYQAQFLSYQERQKVAHTAQVAFFHKYHRQEHLQVNHVVTERLDVPMILDLIDQHDVVFVCTDTGSGKSTRVPRALLELSPHTRVVSTQPRRTATVSIATRVASLRRENVGEDVGYWIRGEKKGDEQTRLWYMTSYTLLLRILETPGQLPFTHVVLDEFHERQPDLEVTVALLRLALQHQHQQQQPQMQHMSSSSSNTSLVYESNSSDVVPHVAPFKLILMSATLNTEDWEQYFDGLRVATYKQSEPEHPIHDYFLEDICELLALDYAAPPNLLTRPVVERDTLERHLYIAQNLILFINGFSHPHHSILVFLPGRAQVESLQSWSSVGALAQRVDVIPWHSAVDLSEIESAMTRRLPHRQKVYLATDIAEVSITLPDVVYVIDLVLVKRPKMNKDIAASILYPPLVTQWISKGSVAQRRGRIGRVQQGFYFCLFPAAQVSTLPDYAQPPIENARVDELALHCLQVVSNPVAIFSICHGQPLMATVALAMNTLSELGCIVPVSSSNGGSNDEPVRRVPECEGEHAANEEDGDDTEEDEDEETAEEREERMAGLRRASRNPIHPELNRRHYDRVPHTDHSTSRSAHSNLLPLEGEDEEEEEGGAAAAHGTPRRRRRAHTRRGRQALWSARVLASAQRVVTTTIHEYRCTFIGRMLQRIPVSPQPGMLIFFGFLTGLESLMILAAAVMSSLSPFCVGSGSEGVKPRGGRFTNMARAMEDTENVMRDMCCGLRSDTVAVMKATLLFRLQVASASASASTDSTTPSMPAALAHAELSPVQQQHVRQWCLQKHLSYDKLLAIVDLEQHIKFELAEFMPFRDVSEASALLEQLDKLAAMVVVMTNVAFVAQALEVTSESNLYTKTQEMALGLFSDLLAVPDIHSPSCLRWQEGDIVVPVQLNLFFDKLLASFSTAIASPRQFWMSLLLFAQRLRYASFSDDAGTFHVFCITYCGKDRFMELDEIAGLAVLEFRRKLSVICATLRLIRLHRTLEQWELEKMLQNYGLKSLPEAQREVITMLVSIFNNLDSFTVDEVAHDEDDLDEVSALSFAIPH